jgi:hypothetical protein
MNREAVHCRRQAQEFQGKPEAAFLLRLADSFDDLAGIPSAVNASSVRASNGSAYPR